MSYHSITGKRTFEALSPECQAWVHQTLDRGAWAYTAETLFLGMPLLPPRKAPNCDGWLINTAPGFATTVYVALCNPTDASAPDDAIIPVRGVAYLLFDEHDPCPDDLDESALKASAMMVRRGDLFGGPFTVERGEIYRRERPIIPMPEYGAPLAMGAPTTLRTRRAA